MSEFSDDRGSRASESRKRDPGRHSLMNNEPLLFDSNCGQSSTLCSSCLAVSSRSPPIAASRACHGSYIPMQLSLKHKSTGARVNRGSTRSRLRGRVVRMLWRLYDEEKERGDSEPSRSGERGEGAAFASSGEGVHAGKGLSRFCAGEFQEDGGAAATERGQSTRSSTAFPDAGEGAEREAATRPRNADKGSRGHS
jgi:hypothetical protein